MASDTAQLREHLAAMYQVTITRTVELDRGVYRVWCVEHAGFVARWFPPTRSFDSVAGDADVLFALEEFGYPAERCARPEPLLDVDDRPVLVTDWVDTVPRVKRRDAIRDGGGLRQLGSLLGQLQTLPASAALSRPGGAWHHVADGAPDAEIQAVLAMLDRFDASTPAVRQLRERVAAVDVGTGLPESFVHPDFVLPNVVASPTGMVLVDWSGAGRAPRVWPLAFFLYAEGAKDPRRLARIAAGYLAHVTLEPRELERLPAIMRARPAVLTAWLLCHGHLTPDGALTRLDEFETEIDALAGPVREAFAG